ncbi:MAG: hypothetical protein J6386_16225 [Candidatus Synoicihabitans palmerolidicus]|nr:hypothetical protein [Candidatus Synoicihabitans palmerolidicus]
MPSSKLNLVELSTHESHNFSRARRAYLPSSSAYPMQSYSGSSSSVASSASVEARAAFIRKT